MICRDRYFRQHLPPARHAERPRAGLFISGDDDASGASGSQGDRLLRRAEPLPCQPGGLRIAYPNYDPKSLAEAICKAKGWELGRVNFYTGVPEATDNAHWHDFWQKKLAAMGRQGIQLFTRSLRYRNKVITLPGGGQHTCLSGGTLFVWQRLPTAWRPVHWKRRGCAVSRCSGDPRIGSASTPAEPAPRIAVSNASSA